MDYSSLLEKAIKEADIQEVTHDVVFPDLDWLFQCCAIPLLKVINIPPIKDCNSLDKFIASIHEIGHCCTVGTYEEVALTFLTKGNETIKSEAEAWIWTLDFLDKHKIDLDKEARKFISFAINTYWRHKQVLELNGAESEEWSSLLERVELCYDDVLNRWVLKEDFNG